MSGKVEEIAWPPLASGTDVQALLDQFEKIQWMKPAEISNQQYKQLALLAEYASNHSVHFARRLQSAGLSWKDICSPEGLKKLPPLSRRDLQANVKEINCRQVPQTHTPFSTVQTSGSSGEPVTVLRTKICQLFWLACAMREYVWHPCDFTGALAVIRANLPSDKPFSHNNWGSPANLFYKTGPGYALPINKSISEQAAWLMQVNPHYLLIYPNNLSALLDYMAAEKISLPHLKKIRTIGETLSPDLRQRVMHQLKVPVTDIYSSQELGIIAIQCPESGLYHVMSENVIVEVLNEQGETCHEGDIGRLVITDLHNFSTPLIRYDIGDYAEIGPACSCGRGLPTLKRIVGRERNMIMINGERSWPLVGFHHYRDIAPIVQYQIIQKEKDLLEVRLVSQSPLTSQQEKKLTDIINKSLGFNFRTRFVYFTDRIPVGKSGKYEEFICELDG